MRVVQSYYDNSMLTSNGHALLTIVFEDGSVKVMMIKKDGGATVTRPRQ
jgi:hypothetical protein